MKRHQQDVATEAGFRILVGAEGGLVPIKNAVQLYGGAKPCSESAMLEMVQRGQLISICDQNVLCFVAHELPQSASLSPCNQTASP